MTVAATAVLLDPLRFAETESGPNSPLDLSFSYELKEDTASGTLFEWRRGSVRCAAGFVGSLQSRVFANSGELEFWCRRVHDLPLGRFEPLPKPEPSATQSHVANVDGELVEFESQRVYDFGEGGWREPAWPDDLDRAYTTQRLRGQRVITGTSSRCPDLAIWVDGDYRGSISTPKDGMYSGVLVSGEDVWINLDGDTRRGALPNVGSESCRPIELATVAEGDEWIYGYQPVGPAVIFGGSLGGGEDCAALYQSQSSSSVARLGISVRGKPCRGQLITEWYSYAKGRNGVLIGNYPEGTLMLYRPGRGRVEQSDLARPVKSDWLSRAGARYRKSDWLPPTGTRYRESQSVVSTMGLVMVGMYPWAELLAVAEEGHLSHRQRLLGGPEKRPNTPLPYFWPALRLAKAQRGIDGLSSLRESPLFPSSWGQRVPSIAVFDGRVCAATGNFGGTSYDPISHPYLSRTVARKYGTVFCAPTENQTMVAEPLPERGRLRFVVSERELQIYVDSHLVARRQHSLRPADLAALRGGGSLNVGVGPYGEIAGSVRQRGR